MSNPVIATATVEHASELFSLVNTAYENEKTRKPGAKYYSDPKELENAIANVDKFRWLVLLSGNQVVGSLRIEEEEKGKYCLGAFAVDKDYRGKGYGAGLINFAIDRYLKGKQITEVYLE